MVIVGVWTKWVPDRRSMKVRYGSRPGTTRREARRKECRGGLFCEFGHRRRAAGLSEKSPDGVAPRARLPGGDAQPARDRRSYGAYFVQTRVIGALTKSDTGGESVK